MTVRPNRAEAIYCREGGAGHLPLVWGAAGTARRGACERGVRSMSRMTTAISSLMMECMADLVSGEASAGRVSLGRFVEVEGVTTSAMFASDRAMVGA